MLKQSTSYRKYLIKISHFLLGQAVPFSLNSPRPSPTSLGGVCVMVKGKQPNKVCRFFLFVCMGESYVSSCVISSLPARWSQPLASGQKGLGKEHLSWVVVVTSLCVMCV